MRSFLFVLRSHVPIVLGSSLQINTMTRTIIITGGSQGLGKCIALNLLQNYSKANVVVVARNQNLLQEFYEELDQDKKSRFLSIVGDVTEESTVDSTLEQTLNKFGSIDGVIFNAGVIEPVGHLDTTDYDIEGMKRLFDINYFSIVLFLNKLLCRVSNELNLVFVSSGASTRGIDGWLAYGSSKAAVNQLCKQLHDEMFPRIKCVSIAPGVVNTQMQKVIREELGSSMTAEAHEKFINLHQNGNLLDGMVVGKVYAREVMEGIESTVLGEYIRWNDRRL